MREAQVARPPRASLDWAGAAVQGKVTRVRALTGGMTSAMHQLSLRLDDGETRQVVLRRYVRPEILDEEPGIVDRERRALRLLEPMALPTPRLLASDASARDADVPSLLMSRVPGRPIWPSCDIRWLRSLAEALPPLHATTVGPESGIPAFRPYEPARYGPPPWMKRPELWERALEVFRQPVDEPSVLIHRDYHPGNVLWRRGKLSGVVDWQVASTGPPSIDVGWCRLNLVRECGLTAAERFTGEWEALTGNRYHPGAEVALLVDLLGETDDAPAEHFGVYEKLLGAALAAL